eukprot:TRINITY_DN3560_c0_g1_i12.p1 TRINITY_DN3560_c0_g1~~TRINITY_DN3560_c0_g1_i12.p1  ORF type:complete len:435 (-),score=75.73 TRINITY_DN3560_c0_g1_i12:386-1690(-)
MDREETALLAISETLSSQRVMEILLDTHGQLDRTLRRISDGGSFLHRRRWVEIFTLIHQHQLSVVQHLAISLGRNPASDEEISCLAQVITESTSLDSLSFYQFESRTTDDVVYKAVNSGAPALTQLRLVNFSPRVIHNNSLLNLDWSSKFGLPIIHPETASVLENLILAVRQSSDKLQLSELFRSCTNLSSLKFLKTWSDEETDQDGILLLLMETVVKDKLEEFSLSTHDVILDVQFLSALSNWINNAPCLKDVSLLLHQSEEKSLKLLSDGFQGSQRLESLSVCGRVISENFIQAVVSNFRSVRELRLKSSVPGMTIIFQAQSEDLPLELLNVSSIYFTEHDLDLLGVALQKNDTLTALSLQSTRTIRSTMCTDEGFTSLFNSLLSNSILSNLEIGNDLGPHVMSGLCFLIHATNSIQRYKGRICQSCFLMTF